jgi:transposase
MASVVGDNLSRDELLVLVRELREQNAALMERVGVLERALADTRAELTATRAELTATRAELAAARKNSSNSSRPPSSDITRPPPQGRRSQRRIGGQPGHARHARPAFPPEQVNRVHDHRLDACPDCGGVLSPARQAPRVIQQVEIVARPVRVDEHRGHAAWCRHCQRLHYASLPPAVEAGGLLGPRLTAVVAYLKGACHASYSTIRRFFRDVLGLSLSRGYLAKLLRKATRAMAGAYDALRRRLPSQSRLNVDETGHRENGRRPWTWCFRADEFTLFKIADSRGSDVLWDMLGSEFRGVLGCDYFSAYRKYMKDADVRVQFCLAHLIRELKFMTTLPDRATAVYAESLLMALRSLFRVIHRRDRMSPRGFARALQWRRDVIVRLATQRVPHTSEARNLAARFRTHGPAYFTFVTSPHLPPTNNLAEQAIRFVVIDRHITQGTRSPTGRAWCERIWTVLATCAQQGRSAFEFLHTAIQALFHRQSAPTILCNTS